MCKDCTNPFQSLEHCVACHSRDWAKHYRDAWLWGIICGWEEEAFDEIIKQHNWQGKTAKRLKHLRKEFVKTKEHYKIIKDLIKLLDVYENRKGLISNQGQALDGYTALAEFVNIATKAKEIDNCEDSDEFRTLTKFDCAYCEGTGEIDGSSYPTPDYESDETCLWCGGTGIMPNYEKVRQVDDKEQYLSSLETMIKNLKNLDGKELEQAIVELNFIVDL